MWLAVAQGLTRSRRFKECIWIWQQYSGTKYTESDCSGELHARYFSTLSFNWKWIVICKHTIIHKIRDVKHKRTLCLVDWICCSQVEKAVTPFEWQSRKKIRFCHSNESQYLKHKVDRAWERKENRKVKWKRSTSRKMFVRIIGCLDRKKFIDHRRYIQIFGKVFNFRWFDPPRA